ncbi:amidase [Rhodococcus sp. SC4]|nr:amidase [Rhodococcus sp. SC4]
MQPHELDLTAAADAISRRELSPVELIDSALDHLDRVDPHLSAFVTVTADAARREAAIAESEIAAGRYRGPLHGIPIAIKDLFDTAGVLTTSSSAVRATHVPDRDATAVRKLQSAGAISLGKTHTHEFAFGTITPQSRNPWAVDRVPGGSSGGSAIAVSAGIVGIALGSDTGGSIRIPSALCGVVGLKPTFGLVSRAGVTPLSWSLDHVGPIAGTVRDAAVALDALVGYDDKDPASLRHTEGSYVPDSGRDLTDVRVGVPTNYYFDNVEPEVQAHVLEAIDTLAGLGATLVEVELPLTHLVQATQWGLMVPEATTYHQDSLNRHPELYSDDVRILLEAGQHLLATDYLRAQRSRALIRQAWADLFDDIDVLAAPTVTSVAARAGQETIDWPDGTSEGISDTYVRLSSPANLTGLPALSVPVRMSSDGLPIGMQLIGRPLAEATLLQVGASYELARGPVRVPGWVGLSEVEAERAIHP